MKIAQFVKTFVLMLTETDVENVKMWHCTSLSLVVLEYIRLFIHVEIPYILSLFNNNITVLQCADDSPPGTRLASISSETNKNKKQ